MRSFLQAAAFAAALLFFGVLAGVFSSVTGGPPYSWLKRPLDGLFALYIEIKETYLDHPAWGPARGRDGGLLRHDPERSVGGLTLYTSADMHGAMLLDENGTELYRWHKDRGEMWSEDDVIDKPYAGRMSLPWKTQIMPDGGILVLFALVATTPYGGGLARLDIDGNLEWKFFEHAHHDFAVRDDGSIAVLVHAWKENPQGRLARVGDIIVEDSVVILEADGTERDRFSLNDAIIGSGFDWLLDGDRQELSWDITHSNSILPLSAETAAMVPGAEEGDFLISMRELHAAVVVSHTTHKVVWARRGPFHGQHDAEFTSDGNLLIYDNKGAWPRGEGSRVIEIDPDTMQVVWQFPKPGSKEVMSSSLVSWQQPLDRGNMLVVETMAGRVLEITHDGDVVWEYVNPVRDGSGVDEMPIIAYAERIKRSALPDALRARLEGAQSTGAEQTQVGEE